MQALWHTFNSKYIFLSVTVTWSHLDSQPKGSVYVFVSQRYIQICRLYVPQIVYITYIWAHFCVGEVEGMAVDLQLSTLFLT